MTKFWYAVGGIFAVSLLLLAVGVKQDKRVNFSDLETECRYDRMEQSFVDLNRDNTLSFEGNFPVDNPDSKLTYSYKQTSSEIVLNIRESGVKMPEFFKGDCLGSAVYKGTTTQPLEPGRYKLTVKHDGKVEEEAFIRVRE